MEISPIKRRKRTKRRSPWLWAAPLIAAVVFLVIAVSAGGPLAEVARERVSECIASALNEASAAAFTGAEGELLSVSQTGEATFIINADTAALGAASARVLRRAGELIEQAGERGAEVRMGSASRIALLTGLGPKVRIRFKPIGTVEGRLVSRLKSAGINQSLFTVELSVTARALAVIGGRSEEVEIKTAVPLCETVVVGAVPQVYTNVADEEDMLNLIPTDLP